MKITAKSIVSNSDMIKNYKTCREKAEIYSKVYILKNNQPDAVLLSIKEYDRLSAIIEKIEELDKENIERIAEIIKTDGLAKNNSLFLE